MAGCSLLPFLDSVEGKKSKAFENEGRLTQGIKCSFLCNLLEWAKVYLVFGLYSIVDFVDWLGLV